MSLNGTFCSERGGIEEIKDVHEETPIKGDANYFKNNSGKYEKTPHTGNLQMKHIELILH
jgi:hypothetical protein